MYRILFYFLRERYTHIMKLQFCQLFSLIRIPAGRQNNQNTHYINIRSLTRMMNFWRIVFRDGLNKNDEWDESERMRPISIRIVFMPGTLRPLLSFMNSATCILRLDMSSSWRDRLLLWAWIEWTLKYELILSAAKGCCCYNLKPWRWECGAD